MLPSQNILAITIKLLKTLEVDAIHEHACSYRPSANYFKILDSVRSDIEILTCEALLIRDDTIS